VEQGARAQLDAIVAKLEMLQVLAHESRRELDVLKEMSADILESVRPKLAAPHPPSLDTLKAVPILALRLLGSFEVRLHGKAIERWPSRKARLLLAYLTIERGRMVPGCSSTCSGRMPPGVAQQLSIAIHQLRTTLADRRHGGEMISCARACTASPAIRFP
jgi:hypothetical protein